MFRLVAKAVLCMPAVLAGMHAFAQTTQTLDPEVAATRTLRNGDTHVYRPSINGDVKIVVNQLGRGTILSVCRTDCSEAGSRLARSASWRGPEHFYNLILSIDNDTVFEITPDEDVAPVGEYRITLTRFPRTEPSFAGELAMTMGADRHLRHYFGEDDARAEAADHFDKAAEAFDAAGDRHRLADALFEGAVVRYYLGQNRLANDRFRSAEVIWRDLGDERGIASAENQRGLISQLLGDNPATDTTRTAIDGLISRVLGDGISTDPDASAIELFESAAERRRLLGDEFFFAQVSNNLGIVYRELGDGRVAVRYFEEALQAWQGSVDLMATDPSTVDFSAAGREPWLHHALLAIANLGWAYDRAARPDLAERHFQQALALSEYLERGRIAAEIRNNYGTLMYRIGNLQSALVLLEQALAYFESAARDETWAAEVHNNLGLVYSVTGDNQRAIASFDEALRLRTPERDPVGRAETLRNLALLQIGAGRMQEALDFVDEALAMLEATPSLQAERAHLYDITGRAHVELGQTGLALEHLDLAVAIYQRIGALRDEARARTNRAYAYHVAGRDIRALPEFEVALDLARQIESLPEQFRVLGRLAEIRFNRQEFGLAYDLAREAVSASERLRSLVQHPALLREYASVQQDAFDVLINSALQTGDVEAAWSASDRARARRFTELLRRSDVALSNLEAADRVRYGDLRLRVAALAQQRSDYLAKGDRDAAGDMRRELIPLLNEMDSMVSPAIDHSVAGEPAVSLPDLQTALGPDDLLLEYYLSPKGTGVWRIRRDAMDFLPLPGFAEIESAVRALRQALQRATTSPDTEIHELSTLLFDGSIDLFADSSRLIVIPDGALHMIPFAVLDDPTRDGYEPLIAFREVSYLPSAAALLALRRREIDAGDGIVVLADPVFDASDPRIERGGDANFKEQVALLFPDLRRGAAVPWPEKFHRLPGTRDESQAIRESAGDMTVRLVLDTEANRDTVLSGTLNDYRILHFATHAVLDVEEPALSGLVLSAVTKEGQPRAKFLLTQDIVSMDLKAELVVLSGCDTGFGHAVRGEGLISLSRAFFYAGAEQVISTLWQVPDRATADLMGHFYRRLLQNGASPVTALRDAQLAVMQDRRWRSPYFWAAFVLQGDWSSREGILMSAGDAAVAQRGNE